MQVRITTTTCTIINLNPGTTIEAARQEILGRYLDNPEVEDFSACIQLAQDKAAELFEVVGNETTHSIVEVQ